MDSISLRQAEAADAKAIAGLSFQLGYTMPETDTLTLLKRLSESIDNAVFVAVFHHEPVGWIHVFSALRLESGMFCEIGGLVTHEKFRGNGIGRRLLERARQWALECGASKLVVRSNVTRGPAHEFYLKNGFCLRKTQHVFEYHI